MGTVLCLMLKYPLKIFFGQHLRKSGDGLDNITYGRFGSKGVDYEHCWRERGREGECESARVREGEREGERQTDRRSESVRE